MHINMEDASKQAILTSIAYHWTWADKAVIRLPDFRKSTIVRTFKNSGTASPSPLGLLPPEILDNILEELDFESIGVVRCLNIRSEGIVAELPGYLYLTTYAREALQALSATGMLSRYTVSHLYSALCHDRCTICNCFGSFIFLPTGRRCCFSCIENSPELRVISVSAAAAEFGLAGKALSRLPILLSIPGEYGTIEKVCRRRLRVLSLVEARKLGLFMHGSETRMQRAASLGLRRSTVYKDNDMRPTPFARRSAPKPLDLSNILRFMVCVPLPSVDLQRHRIDKGFSCRGCEYNWYRRDEDFPTGYETRQELYRRMNTAFSEDEFFVHYENCPSARMLWEDCILKKKEIWETVPNTIFRT